MSLLYQVIHPLMQKLPQRYRRSSALNAPDVSPEPLEGVSDPSAIWSVPE